MSSYDFRAQQVKTGKLIVSSSTEDAVPNRLLIYPVEVDGTPSNQGNINQVTFATSSIGGDVYVHFYGSNTKVVSFGGKTKFSSSINSLGGFSGSHQFLADGTTPAFVGGPNITVNFIPNGAVAISGSSTGADSNANYLLTSATASLANSRLIASGVGIELFDNGVDKLIISSRLTAGNNINFISGTNGTIVISSLSGSVFTVSATYAKTTSSISIDTSGRYSSQIGSDVYFFVSGSEANTSVFQGRLNVSGTIKAHSGISGSIQRLLDGSPAFVPGNYTLITTQSNGAIAVSSSLSFVGGPNITINDVSGTINISGSARIVYHTIASYNTTIMTSSVAIGQFAFVPSEVPTSSILLRAILNTVTASNFAYVKLYNITSGSYVGVGGSTNFVLSSSLTTPTKIESVNLSTATNWSTGSSLYQLELYSSSSLTPTILGNATIVYS